MTGWEKMRFWTIFWGAVGLAAVLVIWLGACGGGSPVQPVTCATWQAPDGTWMEEDNEEVDADPCDRFEDRHPLLTKSPKPKPSAVRTTSKAQQPQGRNTKGFR